MRAGPLWQGSGPQLISLVSMKVTHYIKACPLTQIPILGLMMCVMVIASMLSIHSDTIIIY